MTEEARLDLIKGIREQIVDEDKAVTKYREMAWSAERLGLASEGEIFRRISEQEATHGGELRAILSRMHWPIKAEEHALSRLFPKTYGDWAELGADIKETDPNTSEEVNNALIDIAGDLPGCEDAKRWLVQKAGELGIT